jgi:hypothetical protein
VLKKVHMMIDPLDRASTEVVEVDDLVAFLRTRWERFPDTGRIYHEVIALDHDVTPHCEADCERLKTMPGPFYVVVFPGYNIAVAFIVAIVVAAATYFLTPTPKIPILPANAARNQQTSSPNNELAERTNRVRLNGRIPDIFGTVRSTPDLIAVPYRVFENNVEVEYAYMCVGRGEYIIDDVRDGDTLIQNIPGAGVVVYNPFESPNNTGVPTGPIFGNYFYEPVLNAKRSNSVNGQVLRPSNSQTFTGNGNVRFRYPNIIEMPTGNSEDFTKYFVNGDEITIVGATMTGGTTVTEALSCKVTNGEFRVTVLYGRVQVPLTFQVHVGLVFPADTADDVRALFTPGAQIVLDQTSSGVDLSGTYTISTAAVVEPVLVSTGLPFPPVNGYAPKYYIVDLVSPATVNSNWNNIGPLDHVHGSDDWDYYPELQDRTFDASLDETETYNLDLDNTYTVVSVTQWQMVLNDPGSVDSDWATINTNGGVTPYLSPVMSTTAGSRWVGPFIIAKDDTIRVFSNFVAVNGLYKDNGVDQFPVSVVIEIEIAAVDENDFPTGPLETFTVTMIGSATLKETIAQTIKAALLSFSGRCQVRARRVTETDDAFEGTVVDEVRWRDLYAVSSVGQPDFGNVTTVQCKTYATASALAVKERKLNMLVQRKIPARVGSTSSFTDTALVGSNRADDIFMAICRDRYLGNKSVTEIDVDNIYNTVQEIEDYFGHPNTVEFCYTFDNDNLSFEETLSVLADAIFSVPYRLGSVIKIAFEKFTQDATLLFNHRNKLPGSERRTFTFGTLEENDGLEYTYVNPDDDSIISVFLPEATPSSSPKKVESVGVRNHLQAYFHAWRIWNKMLYSNITTEFEATQEAMLLVKNDRFLNTDSTRAGSQDGEVIDVSGLTLTLSQNVDLTADPPYTIFLQLYDGTTQAIQVTAGAEANQVVLAEAPNLSLVTDSKQYARTAYMIGGDTDPRQTAFLLVEKSANSGLISTIKAINYDGRYYLKDPAYINDEIGVGGYGPSGGYGIDTGPIYHEAAPVTFTEFLTWDVGGSVANRVPINAVYLKKDPALFLDETAWTNATLSHTGDDYTANYSGAASPVGADHPVLIAVFASGSSGTPSSVTYGDLPMDVRYVFNPDTDDQIALAMLPLRSLTPASSEFKVTWASGPFQIKATFCVISGISADSDNFANYVSNSAGTGTGEVTLTVNGIDQEGGYIVTACMNPLPDTPNPPGGYTESGNSALGDNGFKGAFSQVGPY